MTSWSSRSIRGEEWRLQFARAYRTPTVSTVDISQWRIDSRELQGIRLGKIGQRPGHNCNVWRLQCQVKHVGSTGQQLSGESSGRSLGWRHLQSVTPPVPTRLGSWQGDTDSTVDLALVSPRIAPWLTPHGSGHLPVVFSLQKPAKKQNIKPHNPSGMKGRFKHCVKTAQ